MFDNDSRFDVLLSYLDKSGIKEVRFGINLVTIKSLNKYGDLSKIIPILKKVQDNDFKIHLYLFLSDDIANAGQGKCPKLWRNRTIHSLRTALADDCSKCVDLLEKNEIIIDSYTVGNESEWGICGFRFYEKISNAGMKGDQDFAFLRNELWYINAHLIKACCEVLYEKSSNSKVIIHSNSIGIKNFTYEYLTFMADAGVPFDLIGLTYCPWTKWDDDYHNFTKLRDAITKLKKLRKPIWIVEYSYPRNIIENGELTVTSPSDEYYYNDYGQTNFHLDFLDKCKNMGIDAVFFWRGEHEYKTDFSYKTGIMKDGEIDKRLLDKLVECQSIQ